MRPGYKQTEVGVIPEDWLCLGIGESMSLINGRAFRPSDWQKHGTPIIRIQNLNDPYVDFNYYSGAIKEKNQIESGVLLFAWSGTRGTSFGARVWSGPTGVLNQHIFKVIPNQKSLTKRYAYLALRQAQESIEREAHGFKDSFVHVKKSDLTKIRFPLPSTKAEQEAIAEALGDADAWIESLEKLIAKKRLIKQGSMQQLLTPPSAGQARNTRLPGFEGEWVEKRLGDVCSLGAGGDLRYAEYSFLKTHKHPYPIYANGNTKKGLYGHSESFDYLGGKVTVTARGDVGHAEYREQPFCAIGRLLVLTPHEDVDGKYLSYYLDNRVVFANESTGVPQLTAPQASKYIVAFPPTISEQYAIAKILSDMDNEIEVLETKLSKARKIKEGMMSELLTGKTRLVEVGKTALLYEKTEPDLRMVAEK